MPRHQRRRAQCYDYALPKFPWKGLAEYARAIARRAFSAYQTVRYHDWVPLAVATEEMTLRRREPDAPRLAWANELAAKIGDRLPKTLPEIYALEAIYLHREPVATFTLQAMRIGELGITAIPCEVFGISGLKLKGRSPLECTMNIALANGFQGYIPPPEQHRLGGYTTWPARTAGLEETAEPKIVAAMLGLLEQVSGKPQRKIVQPRGPYAEAVLKSKPAAYLRLGEIEGSFAQDASRNHRDGVYAGDVALYLEGPPSDAFCGKGSISRCVHFVGGHVSAALPGLGDAYSVSPLVLERVAQRRPPRHRVLVLSGRGRPDGLGRQSGDCRDSGSTRPPGVPHG